MSIMVNTSTRKDIIHIDIRKKSESFAGKRRSRQDSSVLEAFRTIQEAPSKHERVKVLDAEGAIFFHKIWSGITRHTAQPTSPKGDFDFEGVYESVPDILPPLDGIELPYVRDVGVKESIRILGSYFQCDNYDVNLCHFWFLDVVVDALWRAQDVYNFEMEQQRAVLEWIICIFNFIRDRRLNITRKEFFRLFKAAIFTAGDVLCEGKVEMPPPNKLFRLEIDEFEEENFKDSDDSSTSGSSISLNKDYSRHSLIVIKKPEKTIVGKLPPAPPCHCDILSVQTTTTSTTNISKEIEEEVVEEENVAEEEIQYYRPDYGKPSRWYKEPLPLEPSTWIVEKKVDEKANLSEDEKTGSNLSSEEKRKNSEEKVKTAKSGVQIGDEEVLDDFVPVKSHESIFFIKSREDWRDTDTTKSYFDVSRGKKERPAIPEGDMKKLEDLRRKENLCPHEKKWMTRQERKEKEELLRKITEYVKMDRRIKDMGNWKKGWVPSEESVIDEVVIEEDEEDDDEWEDIQLNEEKIRDRGERRFINFCVLYAVIELFFEYFYESLHFTLIRFAYQGVPNVIYQKVNKEWQEPKVIKEELLKPKEKHDKKKKKKDKKKGSKKSKKSSKKKSKKGSKKGSKKSSKKGSKKGKGKKEKKKKLTKEEKEELERQRKERELIEAEMRKLEENRRYMFPLKEGADDEFFKNIFENWVKVDIDKMLGKKKGGKKGGKKGKKKK